MANQIVWLHHGGKVIRRNIRLVLTDTGRSSWIVREIGLRFTPIKNSRIRFHGSR